MGNDPRPAAADENLSTRLSSLGFKLAFVFVALAFSYYFTVLRFQLSKPSIASRYSLLALLTYTADLPFQYRVLPIWIMRLIAGYLPDFSLPAGVWISHAAALKFARAAIMVEFVSVLATLFAFRYYMKLLLGGARSAALATLSLLVALPFVYLLPRYHALWFPSDLPALLFFLLGIICLYKRAWGYFYLIFLVGTFNRETTILLTFVYLVTAIGKDRKARIAWHCAAQVVLWLSVKYLLYRLFGSNPTEGGKFFEQHFIYNLHLISEPQHWGLFLSLGGFAWIPAVLGYRQIESDFVRRALLVTIPFLIAALIVGIILEMRIYGELLAVLLPAAVLAIKGMIIRDNRTRTASDA